jgi:hypothetical protein
VHNRIVEHPYSLVALRRQLNALAGGLQTGTDALVGLFTNLPNRTLADGIIAKSEPSFWYFMLLNIFFEGRKMCDRASLG